MVASTAATSLAVGERAWTTLGGDLRGVMLLAVTAAVRYARFERSVA